MRNEKQFYVVLLSSTFLSPSCLFPLILQRSSSVQGRARVPSFSATGLWHAATPLMRLNVCSVRVEGLVASTLARP